MELFTFIQMGGKRERITVRELVDDARSGLAAFDAHKAECFLPVSPPESRSAHASLASLSVAPPLVGLCAVCSAVALPLVCLCCLLSR